MIRPLAGRNIGQAATCVALASGWDAQNRFSSASRRMFGAEGETRTRTTRRPLAPQASASTNSATSAEENYCTRGSRGVRAASTKA